MLPDTKLFFRTKKTKQKKKPRTKTNKQAYSVQWRHNDIALLQGKQTYLLSEHKSILLQILHFVKSFLSQQKMSSKP